MRTFPDKKKDTKWKHQCSCNYLSQELLQMIKVVALSFYFSTDPRSKKNITVRSKLAWHSRIEILSGAFAGAF